MNVRFANCAQSPCRRACSLHRRPLTCPPSTREIRSADAAVSRLRCTAAATASTGLSSSSREEATVTPLTEHEVRGANAIKVGRITDLEKAAGALVFKLMELEEGGEVEVWAAGSLFLQPALKVICKAQGIAAQRGFTFNVAPFESLDVRPPEVVTVGMSVEEMRMIHNRKKMPKVVWVVSKQEPPVDLDVAVESAFRFKVHQKGTGDFMALVRNMENQLNLEVDGRPQDVVLEFMGEKSAVKMTKALLKLYSRAYSDDTYVVLPHQGEVAGAMDGSSKVPGFMLLLKRNLSIEE